MGKTGGACEWCCRGCCTFFAKITRGRVSDSDFYECGAREAARGGRGRLNLYRFSLSPGFMPHRGGNHLVEFCTQITGLRRTARGMHPRDSTKKPFRNFSSFGFWLLESHRSENHCKLFAHYRGVLPSCSHEGQPCSRKERDNLLERWRGPQNQIKAVFSTSSIL